MNTKRIIAQGYDQIAERYPKWQGKTPSDRMVPYVDRATERLGPRARVLDLGCGKGVYTRYLSERFEATGVDISGVALRYARRDAPGATFLRADMASLAFAPGSFDAIVALYSVIHVPREEHEPLVRRLFDWLRPGRRLFVVMGSSDWEGSEQDWLVSGVEMHWSHYDAETNLKLVERAGFEVLLSEIEPDPLDGAHLFILAEKPV